MTEKKRTTNVKTISIYALILIILLLGVLLFKSNKLSTILTLFASFILAPLSNSLFQALKASKFRYYSMRIGMPIFLVMLAIILAFNSDTNKEREMVVSFINSKQENLLLENVSTLDNAESLYFGESTLYKEVSNSLTEKTDSMSKTKTIIFSPKFHSSYRDTLQGDYLKTFGKNGNLIDYDIHFEFNKKQKMVKVFAVLHFLNGTSLIQDSSNAFRISDYLDKDKMSQRKEVVANRDEFEDKQKDIRNKKADFEKNCIGSATGVFDLYVETQKELNDPKDFYFENTQSKFWVKEDHVIVIAVYSFANVLGGKEFITRKAKVSHENCSLLEIME